MAVPTSFGPFRGPSSGFFLLTEVRRNRNTRSEETPEGTETNRGRFRKNRRNSRKIISLAYDCLIYLRITLFNMILRNESTFLVPLLSRSQYYARPLKELVVPLSCICERKLPVVIRYHPVPFTLTVDTS